MKAWFSRLLGAKEVEPAADMLVNIFARHVPADQWQNHKRVETAMRDVSAYAKGERRKHNWGGMKLAMLGNQVLWKMVEKGYPKDFAKKFCTELSITLAQDKAHNKAAPPAKPGKRDSH